MNGTEGVWYCGSVLTLSKRRGIGSTSTGTGKRADPGDKRRDRRSMRGSSSYWWGWSRRLVRLTVMGCSCCLHAGEWYPPDGVIILEFGTVFRRSP